MSCTINELYDYQGVKKWFNDKFPEYGKGQFVSYVGFELKIESEPPASSFGRKYRLDACKVKFSVSCDELDYSERGKIERGQYKLSTITKEKIEERIVVIKDGVAKILEDKKQFKNWSKDNLATAKKLINEAFPEHDLNVVAYGHEYLVKKGDTEIFKFFLSNGKIDSVKISLTGSLESLIPTIAFKIYQNG